MRIGKLVEPINSIELDEIKDKTLEEIINYTKEKKLNRLYVTQNERPLFVFTPEIFLDVYITNKLHVKIGDFLKDKTPPVSVDADKHIIDTYNYLRKHRLNFAPVVKDGKLIGEITFSTLSLKISFIAIKDPLTDTYNEKYFNVLVEEYNEIGMQVGIIMIKVENLSIYESVYGSDFESKILKAFGKTIKNSVRDVDFVFRNDNVFKILTFNNSEITMKIKHRIEGRLNDLVVDDLKVPFKIVATHIPELESSILLAVERLEGKLFS
jgi:GGDEF domain-containing protein